jgi:hypothetical protein
MYTKIDDGVWTWTPCTSIMQITVTWEPKQSDSLTVQQFKDLLASNRPFTRIHLVQEGIPNIISTMCVTIAPSGDAYTISISGTGYNANRTVQRSEVYKTLLDGYGLWKL